MLDVAYRRRQLALRRRQIDEKKAAELAWFRDGGAPSQRRGSVLSPASPVSPSSAALGADPDFAASCRVQIEADPARTLREALNTYGNDF